MCETYSLYAGRVYIGVTGEKLLVSKKFGELLQPYADRAAAAAEYVRRLRPAVAVQTGELTDPMVRWFWTGTVDTYLSGLRTEDMVQCTRTPHVCCPFTCSGRLDAASAPC
jgi:phosphopantetheine adenylyltransferase